MSKSSTQTELAAEDSYVFPMYKSRDFYITGESCGGNWDHVIKTISVFIYIFHDIMILCFRTLCSTACRGDNWPQQLYKQGQAH